MEGGKEMNVSSKSLSDHVVWNGKKILFTFVLCTPACQLMKYHLNIDCLAITPHNHPSHLTHIPHIPHTPCHVHSTQDTFMRAKNWIRELQRQASPNIVIALSGNKVDLASKRAVDFEVGGAGVG